MLYAPCKQICGQINLLNIACVWKNYSACSSFRFTAKVSRKYREFPYNSCSNMVTAPLTISIAHQSGHWLLCWWGSGWECRPHTWGSRGSLHTAFSSPFLLFAVSVLTPQTSQITLPWTSVRGKGISDLVVGWMVAGPWQLQTWGRERTYSWKVMSSSTVGGGQMVRYPLGMLWNILSQLYFWKTVSLGIFGFCFVGISGFWFEHPFCVSY